MRVYLTDRNEVLYPHSYQRDGAIVEAWRLARPGEPEGEVWREFATSTVPERLLPEVERLRALNDADARG